MNASVADAHGYEPVWVDGNRPIAYVAAGGYGHALEKSLALSYLPAAHAAVGTALALTIPGERRPNVATEQPLLDPEGRRLLG